MKFYLGTHLAYWLRTSEHSLFVSRRRLCRYKKLPQALSSWCLDSGGFTELSQYGMWTITPQEYVAEVRRYYDEVGKMDWAAPMDAMCEPWVLEKSKNWLGGTVQAHQMWTVQNFITLMEIAGGLPFIPVLQGWSMDDYFHHVEMYDKAGIDLTQFDTVGLGSVCRRQSTKEIAEITGNLCSIGLRLHGFGVKSGGIAKYGGFLESADSMAWSFSGRKKYPCSAEGKTNCAHCWHYACEWRDKLIQKAKENHCEVR